MSVLTTLSYAAGGAFLMNAVPHLVRGVSGAPFQSPFATPPGRGLSSSTVNVVWGVFNVAAAYVLVCRVGDFTLRHTGDAVPLGVGALLMGIGLARWFGRFHGGNRP